MEDGACVERVLELLPTTPYHIYVYGVGWALPSCSPASLLVYTSRAWMTQLLQAPAIIAGQADHEIVPRVYPWGQTARPCNPPHPLIFKGTPTMCASDVCLCVRDMCACACARYVATEQRQHTFFVRPPGIRGTTENTKRVICLGEREREGSSHNREER